MHDRVAEYKVLGSSTDPDNKFTGNVFSYENFVVNHYQVTSSDLKTLVFQFDNTHRDCDDHCYGNKNTDQADLMLHFTQPVILRHLLTKAQDKIQIDYGANDEDACLNSIALGHLGKNKSPLHTEENLTDCVTWGLVNGLYS